MDFLNPWLLYGAGAAVIPLVIHLIFRRKYQRVTWAAMDFLLAAIKQTKRRLIFENILLLLLRMLIVALFALALSRPVLRESSMINLGGDVKENLILVLDTSYSMNYQGKGNRTSFENLKEKAFELLKELKENKDSITLIRFDGEEERNKLQSSTLNTSPKLLLEFSTQLDKARIDIEELQCSQTASSIFDVLPLLKKVVQNPEYPNKRVFILTDLQKKCWFDTAIKEEEFFEKKEEETVEEKKNPKSSLAEEFRKLAEQAALHIVDVSTTDIDNPARNVAILELSPREKLIGVQMEVQFLVRIQNFSNKNYENYSLDFFVDGQKQEGKSDIELKAQEIKEIYFSYEFTTSGPHYISVVSSHDGLELDDRRFLAFHVFESISTLVVDGDPGKHPYESETHILMAALSPLPSDGEIPYIFKPDRIRANELDFKEFTPYQVVILANVETLSADVVERLESFVREGNSLLIFLGNKVLYPDYNQLLYNNGLGLLPLKLRGIAGEAKGSPKNLLGGNYVSYDPENYDHPLLKLFDSSPELAELLESKAPIYQYYTSEEPLATHKDVQVIARYTDPPVGTPAIIEKHFGNGKVILYTTTCDPDWNDLPAAVCYFPLMTETMQYLAHKEDHFQNVEVNHSLERTFPTLIREELEMVLPDEEEGTPTSATRVRLYLDHKEKESTMKVQFNQTSRIGIYEMTGIGEAAEKYRSFYGVNLKTSESDLSPISEKVLKELWGNNEKIKFLKVGASESHTALSNRKDIEYWKALLYCLLGCLLLETFLAQRLGNYSSR